MKRRAFISLLGGAAAWPLAARAQQPDKLVVGILGSVSPAPYAGFVEAIKQGLREAGYLEGRNVAIEYRWAEGQYNRLPQQAAELVDRGVAVIILVGGGPTTAAARAATATIPIVFISGDDPVKSGAVAHSIAQAAMLPELVCSRSPWKQSDCNCCMSWCQRSQLSRPSSTRTIHKQTSRYRNYKVRLAHSGFRSKSLRRAVQAKSTPPSQTWSSSEQAQSSWRATHSSIREKSSLSYLRPGMRFPRSSLSGSSLQPVA